MLDFPANEGCAENTILYFVSLGCYRKCQFMVEQQNMKAAVTLMKWTQLVCVPRTHGPAAVS